MLLFHQKKLLGLWVLLALCLPSCDMLWPDKAPQYWYRIENNTSQAIEVKLEPDRAYASGGRFVQWSIAPGASMNVWGVSGSEEDGTVTDFEHLHPRMTHFTSLDIQGQGRYRTTSKDFNATRHWSYQKNSSHEATYTLQVNEADLQ